jgi:hypothetical protein
MGDWSICQPGQPFVSPHCTPSSDWFWSDGRSARVGRQGIYQSLRHSYARADPESRLSHSPSSDNRHLPRRPQGAQCLLPRGGLVVGLGRLRWLAPRRCRSKNSRGSRGRARRRSTVADVELGACAVTLPASPSHPARRYSWRRPPRRSRRSTGPYVRVVTSAGSHGRRCPRPW